MIEHRLKTWPRFFAALLRGDKTFEVRRDDRGYAEGDTLVLREFRPGGLGHTGREVRRRIAYVMSGGDLGIERGFVVLGLGLEPAGDKDVTP